MEQVENEVVNEASSVAQEQPTDATGTAVVDPAESVAAQEQLAKDTEAKLKIIDEALAESEAPQFAERAFAAEESERVQSSKQERIFVAGVGFVEVSHPK